MIRKRPWQEPLVRSIDQLTPAYGACTVGTTPVAGGPDQCNAGTGASATGKCTTGKGAKSSCITGNGVKV
jgi:hypothetical protein